jgi:hypothetical protein
LNEASAVVVSGVGVNGVGVRGDGFIELFRLIDKHFYAFLMNF